MLARMNRLTLGVFIALVLHLCSLAAAYAQSDHGFRFVRIRYDDPRGERARYGAGPAWSHDYPQAELNLHMALKRTTELYVEGEPLVLRLSDERIFEHPIIYICEPGYWTLEDDEVENFKEFLDRGGFVLFDDFRDEYELAQLESQMERVFPSLKRQEIPPDHPIWSIYYEIDPVEAPSLVGGGFRRFGKYDDQYIAYFDENGRIAALACYNQDIGDGWEYPERSLGDASTISFQMGINFLIYALTH